MIAGYLPAGRTAVDSIFSSVGLDESTLCRSLTMLVVWARTHGDPENAPKQGYGSGETPRG